MRSRGWIALAALAFSAPASAAPPATYSTFDLLGASKTHLALRETYDASAESKRSVRCGYREIEESDFTTGLRYRLIPIEVGKLLELNDKLGTSLPILDSVWSRGECTTKKEAAARHARAKDALLKHGIDPTATVQAVPVQNPPVGSTDCFRHQKAATCRVISNIKLNADQMKITIELASSVDKPECLTDEGVASGCAAKLSANIIVEAGDAKATGTMSRAMESRFEFAPAEIYAIKGRKLFLFRFRDGNSKEAAEHPYLLVL